MSRETCTKPFFNASDVTTIPRHRSTGKERWQNLNVTSARCRPNHDASGLPKHLDELSEPAYSCSVTMLLRYQVRSHRPFCPLFPNADWPRTSKSQLIVKGKERGMGSIESRKPALQRFFASTTPKSFSATTQETFEAFLERLH